jgi:hypothetical protein
MHVNTRFLWMCLIGAAVFGPAAFFAPVSLPGAILVGYCLFSKE